MIKDWLSRLTKQVFEIPSADLILWKQNFSMFLTLILRTHSNNSQQLRLSIIQNVILVGQNSIIALKGFVSILVFLRYSKE